MKRSFLVMILLLMSHSIYSQGLYKNGYIVTLKNDTLIGEIRNNFLRLSGLTPIIKFRQPTEKTVKYYPEDIKGFSIYNGKSYLSIRTDYGDGFGEIIVDGFLRLVFLEIFGSSSTVTPNILYSGYKIFKKGEEVFDVPNKINGFTEKTAAFFSDCPDLRKDILYKKLNYSDIELIVKKYNNWYAK